MRTALGVFKTLETSATLGVERTKLKAVLVQKVGFNDELAEKAIRALFREDMIYESRPGFLRRIGG